MGWNSWNYWGCGVNATILMNTASQIITTGLKKAGYQYVNSDDCWMLAQRDANGNQVADPAKFPDGFSAVTSYIHSLGLSSGLYTAKGPYTCGGRAASCEHEAIDALQWAQWGIDYVKDDSCSTCGSRTDDQDYSIMWSALQAAGRPMVLTVEGDPDDYLLTKGGYGNAKRVGHDIRANWLSMVSLVDIGSGLWLYAHNATNATVGGFWNDLDMLEVGNSPDFVCARDNASLARCQVHFTMWCLLKAPLIMGNNVAEIDPVTLSVLTNPDAIAVNQDPWGVQARRVAVQTPRNTSLGTPQDNVLVLGVCDSQVPTQTWHWRDVAPPVNNTLFVAPCAAGEPSQRWLFNGSLLQNVGSGLCVGSAGHTDPGMLYECNPRGTGMQWSLQASGHVATPDGHCLDVYDWTGPDVEIGSCKPPGDDDSNQVWTLDNATGLLHTASTQLPSGYCLVASGLSGGVLSTTDGNGIEWCATNFFTSEGGWSGLPCSQYPGSVLTPAQEGHVAGNYTLTDSGPAWAMYFGWNNQPGASGPWPHTRYVDAANPMIWTFDLEGLKSPAGGPVMASDTLGIFDDDLVGGVTVGGKFCLDLRTGGMLEVWAGPLSGLRWAVALLNRSPADDVMFVSWDMFNVSTSAAFSVRDVWAAADHGTFVGSYKAAVPLHSVVFLVLTPA